MPAPTTRTTDPNTTRQLPADTSTLGNERRAARQFADFVRKRRPGARNAIVKLYQWAMGELVIDGTIGPKTRARVIALGSALAPRHDVPTIDPERL